MNLPIVASGLAHAEARVDGPRSSQCILATNALRGPRHPDQHFRPLALLWAARPSLGSLRQGGGCKKRLSAQRQANGVAPGAPSHRATQRVDGQVDVAGRGARKQTVFVSHVGPICCRSHDHQHQRDQTKIGHDHDHDDDGEAQKTKYRW